MILIILPVTDKDSDDVFINYQIILGIFILCARYKSDYIFQKLNNC